MQVLYITRRVPFWEVQKKLYRIGKRINFLKRKLLWIHLKDFIDIHMAGSKDERPNSIVAAFLTYHALFVRYVVHSGMGIPSELHATNAMESSIVGLIISALSKRSFYQDMKYHIFYLQTSIPQFLELYICRIHNLLLYSVNFYYFLLIYLIFIL